MSFKGRLEDIVSNGELVLEHKMKYGKSKYDSLAIERALMIIGEAMKVLAKKYKVDWKEHSDMIKMGDMIDHQYSSLDASIIINTIDYDLPELIKLAKRLNKQL